MNTPSFSSGSCKCLRVGKQRPRQPSGCSLLGAETGEERISSTPSLQTFPRPKKKDILSVPLTSEEAEDQAGGSSSRGEGRGDFRSPFQLSEPGILSK